MVSLSIIIRNLLQLRRFPTHNVSMGKHVFGLPYILSSRYSKIIIGNYCSFGRNCTIITEHAHLPCRKEDERLLVSTYRIVGPPGWKQKKFLADRGNFVIIGSDVWVGINTTILPGVRIGNGAVIGAGAVVTRDVPPYAIVAGIPAKVLRYRYTEEQRAKLLKISWWNWPEEKVQANADYFYGNVDDFIQKFSSENSPENPTLIPNI